MYHWDSHTPSLSGGVTKQQEEDFYFINKALQINPDNVEALIAKGSLLLHLGQCEEAAEKFERVLKFDPGNFCAQKYYCKSLVELSKQKTRDDTVRKSYFSHHDEHYLDELKDLLAMEANMHKTKKFDSYDQNKEVDFREILNRRRWENLPERYTGNTFHTSHAAPTCSSSFNHTTAYSHPNYNQTEQPNQSIYSPPFLPVSPPAINASNLFQSYPLPANNSLGMPYYSLKNDELSYDEKVNLFLKKTGKRSSVERVKNTRANTRTRYRSRSRSRDSKRRKHSYKNKKERNSTSCDSIIYLSSDSKEKKPVNKNHRDKINAKRNDIGRDACEGLFYFVGDSMAKDAKPIDQNILKQFEIRDYYRREANLQNLKEMLLHEVIPSLEKEQPHRKILIVIFIGHYDITKLDGVTLIVKHPSHIIPQMLSAIKDVAQILNDYLCDKPNIKVVWTLPMIPDIKRFDKSHAKGSEPSLILRPPFYHSDDDAILLKQIALYANITNHLESSWASLIGHKNKVGFPINLSHIEPRMKEIYNQLLHETYKLPLRFPRVNYRYDGVHFGNVARQDIWKILELKWYQFKFAL